MRFDWTFNVSNLLTVASCISAVGFLLIKMHIRLSLIEDWVRRHGTESERYVNVFETLSIALGKVTVLYEEMQKRVDRIDDRLLMHETWHQGKPLNPRVDNG